MSNESIKIKLKRFQAVRGLLYAKNWIMSKFGLKVMTYGSIYDKETRKFISKYLPEKIGKFNGKSELNVLMIGSPGLQEIRDVPAEVLGRFNITGVDKSPEMPIKLPFNSYTYVNENIFEFFANHDKSKKYDIILNRWFLHHISEKNKESVCKNCWNLLDDNGILMMVDWFIDDWETPEELLTSLIDFYEYHVKYLPHQIPKLERTKKQSPEYMWERFHDDNDWVGGKNPSRERLSKYLTQFGFKKLEVHNVANTDIIDNPHKWGDALVYAEK